MGTVYHFAPFNQKKKKKGGILWSARLPSLRHTLQTSRLAEKIYSTVGPRPPASLPKGSEDRAYWGTAVYLQSSSSLPRQQGDREPFLHL